jgi:hypothetical protein
VGSAARARTGAHGHSDSRCDELSQTGRRIGRCHPAVLRCAREDCQLPGGGDGGVVDRHRGVAVGGDHVSARDVVDSGGADERTDSCDREISAEVAAGAHAAATGARRGDRAHRGGRRCGIRRKCHTPTRVAPLAVAVRVGGVQDPDGLSRHADTAAAHAERGAGPARRRPVLPPGTSRAP